MEEKLKPTFTSKQTDILQILKIGMDCPVDEAGLATALRGLMALIQVAKMVFPWLAGLSPDVWAVFEYPGTASQNAHQNEPVKGRRERYALYSALCRAGQVDFIHPLSETKIRAATILISLVFRRIANPDLQVNAEVVRRNEKHLMASAGSEDVISAKRRSSSSIHAMNKCLEEHSEAYRLILPNLNDATGSYLEKQERRTQEEKERRRTRTLQTSIKHSVALAVGGADCVSRTAMDRVARSIGGEIIAGNERTLSVVLLACLNFTESLLENIKVRISGSEEPSGSTWICLIAGCVYRTLYMVKEEGRKPDPETTHLYETVSAEFQLPLSKIIVDALKELAEEKSIDGIINFHELVPNGLQHLRTSIAPECHQQAITHVILARSLCRLLIEDNYQPWCVACALTAPYLVPERKEHYGAIRVCDIQKAFIAAQRYLGLPCEIDCAHIETDGLVGSAVVPKDMAIQECYRLLANIANSKAVGINANLDELIQEINSVAAWVSFAISHHLALRETVEYPRIYEEIESMSMVRFSDKGSIENVEPMPAPAHLAQIICWWRAYVMRVSARLEVMTHEEAKKLADRIQQQISNSSEALVFEVNRVARLIPVGVRTWRSVLPQRLRLAGNWARHYWSTRLAQRGVSQRAINILMRHHTAHLNHGVISTTRTLKDVHAELAEAMKCVSNELHVEIPKQLRG